MVASNDAGYTSCCTSNVEPYGWNMCAMPGHSSTAASSKKEKQKNDPLQAATLAGGRAPCPSQGAPQANPCNIQKGGANARDQQAYA